MPFAASPTFGLLYRSTVAYFPQAFLFLIIGVYLLVEYNLTTITVELGFLGKFVLLSLKTCSLYHEKLFIQMLMT